MAYPFEKIERLSQANMIIRMAKTFETLPDSRSGDGVHQKYAMSGAALSAFSAFLCSRRLYLDHQAVLQHNVGNNNVQGLFGVHQIPGSAKHVMLQGF